MYDTLFLTSQHVNVDTQTTPPSLSVCQAAVLPSVKEYEKEDPGDERRGEEGRRGDERGKKRGGERRQEDNSLILPSVEEALGSQPLPIMPHSSHSDSIARERGVNRFT